MPKDPYRIADIHLPWTPDDDEADFIDESEWPGADYDARLVAKGKRDEARNRARQYLSMNGAAVWARVERSLTHADDRMEADPGASIVSAVTASD